MKPRMLLSAFQFFCSTVIKLLKRIRFLVPVSIRKGNVRHSLMVFCGHNCDCSLYVKGKGKVIPLQARFGPEGG